MDTKNVELVLGTMTFGESVFSPDVGEFVKTFLDSGHTELDSAYVYNDGNCERLLGEVLPALGRPFRIATKVNPRISGKLDGEAAYRWFLEAALGGDAEGIFRLGEMYFTGDYVRRDKEKAFRYFNMAHRKGVKETDYYLGLYAEKGLLGIMTGGLTASSAGICAAVCFACLIALLFRPKEKS